MSAQATRASDPGAARALTALLLYGGVRGTTETVSEAIAAGMSEAGVTASAVPVNYLRMMPGRVAGADVLGVGSPVYFLREASYVGRAVSELPPLEGKQAFVYCTTGMNRVGETLHRLAEALTARGARVVGAEAFASAMSYAPYKRRGLGNRATLPDEAVLDKARTFGRRMARAPELEPIAPPAASPLTRLKAKWLASPAFRRAILPGIRLDRAKCTGYGSCLSRCLFNGLDRKDGEDIPYVTDSCVRCLLCLESCPRSAVVVDSPFKERLSAALYRLGIH